MNKNKIIDGVINCINKNCGQCSYVSKNNVCQSTKLKQDFLALLKSQEKDIETLMLQRNALMNTTEQHNAKVINKAISEGLCCPFYQGICSADEKTICYGSSDYGNCEIYKYRVIEMFTTEE